MIIGVIRCISTKIMIGNCDFLLIIKIKVEEIEDVSVPSEFKSWFFFEISDSNIESGLVK